MIYISESSDGSTAAGRELQRPRLDTGKNIFSQLTSVFDDLPTQSKVKVEGPVETVNTDGDTTIVHIPDTADEVQILRRSLVLIFDVLTVLLGMTRLYKCVPRSINFYAIYIERHLLVLYCKSKISYIKAYSLTK